MHLNASTAMSLVPHDACRGVQHALPMPHDAPGTSLPQIAAFTFLVRDAADFLEANARAVSSIGRTHFREHRLFYVENDSADGTRAILRRLERELPLSGVMLNVSAERSTALCPPTPEQMNCAARRALLARLRERALELALAWPAWDVLVSVDLDFKRVSADDFVRTVALGARLGAAAVFGMSVFNGSRGVVMPYDQGAVLPKEALRSISLGCLTSVRSAFSGFAAYFAAPLRRARARYDAAAAAADADATTTEHASFNLALHAAGAGPLLVDPRFRPQYEWGDRHFWARKRAADAEAARPRKAR